MIDLKKGVKDSEVEILRHKLWMLGLEDDNFLTNTHKGIFTSDVENKVKEFQSSVGLKADGIVGPYTRWHLGMNTPIPDAIMEKCFCLTAFLETSRHIPNAYSVCAGNFDGQTFSWGFLQFNVGTSSLQRVMNRTIGIAGTDFAKLAARAIIQDPNRSDIPEYITNSGINLDHVFNTSEPSQKEELAVDIFSRLGCSPLFQRAQRHEASREYWIQAYSLSHKFGVQDDELSLALLFDIVVQNGGFNKAELEKLETCASTMSIPDIRITMADLVAKSAKPQWQEDVLKRKMTIAVGHGTVHGKQINLSDFNFKEAQ